MTAGLRIASFAGVISAFVLGFAVLHVAGPDTSSHGGTTAEHGVDVAPGPSVATARGRGLVGVILADEAVDIAARVEGVVTDIAVRLGDRVTAGSAIATIDDRALKNDLAVVRAGLNAAFAERDRANLELAEAREQDERWRELSERDSSVVSTEQLSNLAYKAKYAQQRVKAAEAKVAEYRARVQDLDRQVAESTVRVPFDGLVAQRYVDSGAAVSPGAPIIRLVRESAFWVRFAVPEKRSAGLRHGENVTVRVDTLDVSLPASIAKIAPEVDAASRMIFVEAELAIPENLRDLPLSGRTVRVFLKARGDAPSSGGSNPL